MNQKDRIWRPKDKGEQLDDISKDTENLKNKTQESNMQDICVTIKRQDLWIIGIGEGEESQAKENIKCYAFLATHRTFCKIDHILGHQILANS